MGVTFNPFAGNFDFTGSAGGGGSGHTIQDEGISLTSRTNLDFVGAGVTVTDNAGADKSVVTIPIPSHTALSDIGTNTHAQIDTTITDITVAVINHVIATGIGVHGLGNMSTQDANAVAITGGSIAGITDLAIADGGTGASTAQAAIDALTQVAGATVEHVLTKDTVTGNAIFKAAAGGGGGGTVATGAELNTGTDNVKYASALALADSGYMKPLNIIVNTTGGTTVLTAAENKATSIEIDGALVSDATIQVADTMPPFSFDNLTTGGFDVYVKTSSATTLLVSPSVSMFYANGTDVEEIGLFFDIDGGAADEDYTNTRNFDGGDISP